MALNATVYSFEINLSDLDRNVCQALAFRVAQHPSETDAYLMTRVLAYCLEYREGLSFSKGGLSDPDAPALAVHDLTGALRRWIEVGL
ncbi:MAG TPA: YaeQ family protein, partial [Steroidobacteraceae bacterium]|nr:YaeQ family protein [Steroidobacteraceae bacterium]